MIKQLLFPASYINTPPFFVLNTVFVLCEPSVFHMSGECVILIESVSIVMEKKHDGATICEKKTQKRQTIYKKVNYNSLQNNSFIFRQGLKKI